MLVLSGMIHRNVILGSISIAVLELKKHPVKVG